MMELTVLSAAFVMGAALPPKFCCAPFSPPLEWSQAPTGTQSIAVLCDDPDAPAGDWVHWVLFNLPPETRNLSAGIPCQARLPDGSVQGINDYGRNGYDGPCPPPGRKHRYFFKVFALDTRLNLPASAEKQDLLKAMEGHILAKGEIHGYYGR